LPASESSTYWKPGSRLSVKAKSPGGCRISKSEGEVEGEVEVRNEQKNMDQRISNAERKAEYLTPSGRDGAQGARSQK